MTNEKRFVGAKGIFICQDENEPEDESLRSFWIKPVTNKPGPQYYDTLKDRFVCHNKLQNEPKLWFLPLFSSWHMNML